MDKISVILSFILGLFMVYSGVNHFLMAPFYLPFVPEFMPFREAIVILSGVVEVALGIAVLVPGLRVGAALSIMALMCLFFPVHIADVFKASPAMGSHEAALVRLPVQSLFIFWAWMASRSDKVKDDATSMRDK